MVVLIPPPHKRMRSIFMLAVKRKKHLKFFRPKGTPKKKKTVKKKFFNRLTGSYLLFYDPA
jgi:hypothetical protein